MKITAPAAAVANSIQSTAPTFQRVSAQPSSAGIRATGMLLIEAKSVYFVAAAPPPIASRVAAEKAA